MRVEHEGGAIECEAVDVSLRGMRLNTGFELEYGTPVTLVLRLPALRETSHLSGIVRWAREEQVGVQLLELRAREVWGLQKLLKR